MTRVSLPILLVMVGCKPGAEPTPEALKIGLENISAFASNSVTGDDTIAIGGGSAKPADLDQDGVLDVTLIYVGGDEPGTAVNESRNAHVGWVKGPIYGHSVPSALVMANSDPYRAAWDELEIGDHDGDGALDLLFRVAEDTETWDGGETSWEIDRYFPAWFRGPFREGDPPRELAGDRVVEAAGYYASIGDFNQDGAPDMVLSGAEQWAWFSELKVAPTVANADLLFEPYAGAERLRLKRDSPNDYDFFTKFIQYKNEIVISTVTGTPYLPDHSTRHATFLTDPTINLGDLDGDGADDAAYGSTYPAKIALTAHPDDASMAGFGDLQYDVIGAGDIDGDGDGELSVSLSQDQFPGEGHETTWIWLGPFEGRAYDRTEAAIRIDGFLVEPIGDIDGDGLDDLSLNQPSWPDDFAPIGEERHPGRLWIVHGASLRDALDDR